MYKSVVIIGAGPAGLCAARQFLHDNWTVTVIESQDQVGGVWVTAPPYTTLQSPSDAYFFADFPFPFPVDYLATREQLLRYFAAYADHFGITPRIRFRTRVVGLERRDGGGRSGWSGWRVRMAGWTGDVDEQEFDFVVSAQGTYSGAPNVPVFEGVLMFKSPIVHTSQLRDESVLALKNVVIVGASKSALDCLMRRVKAVEGDGDTSNQKESHWVYRSTYWCLPFRSLNGWFNVLNLIYYRLVFVPIRRWFLLRRGVKPPDAETSSAKKAKPKKTVPKNAWFQLLLARKKATSQASADTTPATNTSPPTDAITSTDVAGSKESRKKLNKMALYLSGYEASDPFLPTELLSFQCTAIMQPPGLFSVLRSPSSPITQHSHTSISHLSYPSTVHLTDGTQIEGVDAIVLATGSRQTMTVPPEYNHLIQDGGMYLYMHMMHPDIPDMAFLHALSSSMTLTSISMGVHWVRGVLNGDVVLPTREEQLAKIEDMKGSDCVRGDKANGVDFFGFCDAVCCELGISPLRKGKRGMFGWVQELMGRYGPKDYEFNQVEQEVIEARKNRKV